MLDNSDIYFSFSIPIWPCLLASIGCMAWLVLKRGSCNAVWEVQLSWVRTSAEWSRAGSMSGP